jgi:hypothetical protein
VTRIDTKPATKAANGFSFDEGTDGHDVPPAKSDGRDLGDAWRFIRDLPRVAQAGIKTNPVAVVAGVGATAFVLGALCGSKVGRVLVTTLAGYGLRRFIEGPVAREVARYATNAMKHAEASV